MRGTDEQMPRLDEIMEQMERAAACDDHSSWTAADEELHQHIAYMADNRPLWRMVEQMQALIGRVRRLAIHQPGRLAQSSREHRRVADAIRARNGDLAAQAMEEHLRTVKQLMVRILENFVVPFKGEYF